MKNTFATIILLFSLSLTATAQKREKYEFERNLPVYAHQLIADWTFPMAWGNSEITDFDEVCDKLNAVLIQGVRIREVYPDGMKIRDLAFLETYIDLVYDDHSSLQEKCESLSKLFSAQSLSVVKKNKNGLQDQDIIPMIKSIEFSEVGEDCLRINLRHCCQNPTLNPMQVIAAIEKYLPELTPVATRCGRLEVFDMHFNVFR